MFVARIEGRTIREALIVLLEVGFRALAARADGHGVVFVGVAGGGEFVEMGTGLVLTYDKETNTIWAPAIFLCVDLGL